MSEQPEIPYAFQWMWPGVDAKTQGQYGQWVRCVVVAKPSFNRHAGEWRVMVKERGAGAFWLPQIADCHVVVMDEDSLRTLPTEYAWIVPGTKAKTDSARDPVVTISTEPRRDAYGWLVGTDKSPFYCGVLQPVAAEVTP